MGGDASSGARTHVRTRARARRSRSSQGGRAAAARERARSRARARRIGARGRQLGARRRAAGAKGRSSRRSARHAACPLSDASSARRGRAPSRQRATRSVQAGRAIAARQQALPDAEVEIAQADLTWRARPRRHESSGGQPVLDRLARTARRGCLRRRARTAPRLSELGGRHRRRSSPPWKRAEAPPRLARVAEARMPSRLLAHGGRSSARRRARGAIDQRGGARTSAKERWALAPSSRGSLAKFERRDTVPIDRRDVARSGEGDRAPPPPVRDEVHVAASAAAQAASAGLGCPPSRRLA